MVMFRRAAAACTVPARWYGAPSQITISPPVGIVSRRRHLVAWIGGMDAWAVPDDPFPSRDIGLDQSPPVVARGFLPSHAAVLGNGLEMPVAPRRCGLRGVARHRIRARRHDYGRLGMARRDFGIDVVAVVGAVAGDGGHRTIDLAEQGTDRGA